jgi:hypothetical protein
VHNTLPASRAGVLQESKEDLVLEPRNNSYRKRYNERLTLVLAARDFDSKNNAIVRHVYLG